MKSGVYTSSDTGTTVATLSRCRPTTTMATTSASARSASRAPFAATDFINAALYDPERLFAGEIGRFHGVRSSRTTTSSATPSPASRGEAAVFGAEAVKEIVVLMEEIRRGVPLDGGRDRSFYWYAILGFKLIWEANATSEPDNRIVHFTSSSIVA
jgi:hypothetical protein